MGYLRETENDSASTQKKNGNANLEIKILSRQQGLIYINEEYQKELEAIPKDFLIG